MKYVLMFVDTEEYTQAWEAMDDAAREQAYQQVDRWFADHGDRIVHSSGKLQPADTATTVRLDADGAAPLVTDGPFLEGKEVISGFVEVDVADLDEALRMAKSWPGCPMVEIRPMT